MTQKLVLGFTFLCANNITFGWGSFLELEELFILLVYVLNAICLSLISGLKAGFWFWLNQVLFIAYLPLNFLMMGVYWKYSILRLNTTDSVLLSLFMREYGTCDIPHAA